MDTTYADAQPPHGDAGGQIPRSYTRVWDWDFTTPHERARMHDATNAVIDQHTSPVEYPAPTSYVGAIGLAQDNSDFVDDFFT